MNEFKEMQEFIARFQETLKRFENLSFVTYKHIEFDGIRHIVDGILIRNKEALALFEFKPGFKELSLLDVLPPAWSTFVSFKYFVVTNGQNHRLLNRYSENQEEFDTEIALLERILEQPTEGELDDTKKKILYTIEKTVKDFLTNPELGSYLKFHKDGIEKHFAAQNLMKNLLFDNDGQFFHFSRDVRDLNNFENTFFKLLIEPVKPGSRIFRYTSLETVFYTLYFKSLRFNGIAGMNDTSEIGYAESYLDNNFIPLETPEEVQKLNQRFILCSSSLEDDLIQWRLYGDDSKGGCLIFELQDKDLLPGLQIRKISYGKKVNNKNYHPELELIKRIIEDVRIFTKQSLQFRALGIWKHFFKSYEYAPEKEVRTLLILSINHSIKGEGLYPNQPHFIKKEWCLTASHKIANPFISISLDDPSLPIRLMEVVLGSKCPESVTNAKQLEQIIKEKKINNVAIKHSIISNYR